MSECKHCHFFAPPPLTGTSWEPAPWVCALGHTVSRADRFCGSYEREPGADDDLIRADASRSHGHTADRDASGVGQDDAGRQQYDLLGSVDSPACSSAYGLCE